MLPRTALASALIPAVLVGLLLAACGAGPSSTPTPTRSDSPAATTQLRHSAAAVRPPTQQPTVKQSAAAAAAQGDLQVDRLNPKLRDALLAATTAAQSNGVDLEVRSGWRSAADQQRLLDQAIVRYGSLAAAEQWVLPPEQSAHVRGAAVDIGPRAGAAWLELEGNRWGLCRRYDNEYWHFELLTEPNHPCPGREPHAHAQ